jgi:peptide deformylase
MIYPIVIYGDPILKAQAKEIDKSYPGLEKLIADMYDTMHNANGIGIAAPQIGKDIRLFVVDASPIGEEEGKEDLKEFKRVFINAEILEESDDEWKFEEGCLSIPGIREMVERPEKILLRYRDEKFQLHEEEFDGIAARIIQHEYDHIEGILFIEHISAFKRSLLKGRLNSLTKGDFDVNYKVKSQPKKK